MFSSFFQIWRNRHTCRSVTVLLPSHSKDDHPAWWISTGLSGISGSQSCGGEVFLSEAMQQLAMSPVSEHSIYWENSQSKLFKALGGRGNYWAFLTKMLNFLFFTCKKWNVEKFFTVRFVFYHFLVHIPLFFLSFPLTQSERKNKKKKENGNQKLFELNSYQWQMQYERNEKGKKSSVSLLQLHKPLFHCSSFSSIKAQIVPLVLLEWRAEELFCIRSETGIWAVTMKNIFLYRDPHEVSFCWSYWLCCQFMGLSFLFSPLTWELNFPIT